MSANEEAMKVVIFDGSKAVKKLIGQEELRDVGQVH